MVKASCCLFESNFYRKYAFPCFLKPPGLAVPDTIVPDDTHTQISKVAPGTGYTTLKPFLGKQQREVDRVMGDGNCLFRALSKAVTGVEDYHISLRKAIAEFESDNHTLFKPIHEAIISTNFEAHNKNIKRQYIWGTTTEIIAAASLFQVDVYVATDSYRPGGVTWLLYTPKPVSLLKNSPMIYLNKYHLFQEPQVQWIELTHVCSIHFDTTKPIKGFRLDHPKLEGSSIVLNQ